MLIIATLNNYSSNGLLGVMFGYVSIIIAVMLLMMITFVNLTDTVVPSFFKLLDAFSPFLLFLSTLAFSIVIISVYYDKLSTSDVSSSYKSFSTISVFFIIVQAILLMYSLNYSTKQNIISSVEVSKLRLLGIINLIVVFSSFISLKYFTTDGFTSIMH
jgi:hypothetical protein